MSTLTMREAVRLYREGNHSGRGYVPRLDGGDDTIDAAIAAAITRGWTVILARVTSDDVVVLENGNETLVAIGGDATGRGARAVVIRAGWESPPVRRAPTKEPATRSGLYFRNDGTITERTTKEPVTLSGWYENTDGSVSEFTWRGDRGLVCDRTVPSWEAVQDPEAELATEEQVYAAAMKAADQAREAICPVHGCERWRCDEINGVERPRGAARRWPHTGGCKS